MEKLNLNDFQKRKLKDFYLAIFVVTKQIKIRNETCITDKTLYLVFGVDIMGDRQILGIYFDNKDNRFWLEKFEDFYARNVKNIIFLVTPQNKNIERCAKIIYNNVKIVHSPDEIFSLIAKFWAYHPSNKTQIALKNLFLSKNVEQFYLDYELFKEVYLDDTIVSKILDKHKDEIVKFYDYNYDLRYFFYPYYCFREMKKYLNKLKTKEPLCTNINEVIEFCLPLINSFEFGRTYSKKDWLQLIGIFYQEYENVMEEYINVKE